jgi:regulator of protease activity HflC (stomatin/prohibitin superfamily)
MGATIIFGALASFVLFFAAKGFKIVQQSETMIIERLGRYNRTLTSGINIIWPVIDRPREIIWRQALEDGKGRKFVRFSTRTRIDLRETVYDFPKQNVITKDNVNVEINALLYFQVMDPVRAVYEIENLPDAIEKLTQTTLRNVIGELELDESLSSRDTINAKLRAILDEATNKWGVKVNRVELQDINPPQDIKIAMEKQMRAERDRRATILEAEGNKRSNILEAEGVKGVRNQQSRRRKTGRNSRAEGEAIARIRLAEAEAKAIQVIADQLRTAGGDPVQYLVAMRYLDTLKEMVSGEDNKTVYLPYEATGVLSSLGGIKDLLTNK